jgi:Arc/MetJ-type ribon-helix-helix transcriptional regulator
MARTMTVDVGDELREFIDSLVKAGDYRTQSEVMRDAASLRESRLNHAFRNCAICWPKGSAAARRNHGTRMHS